MIAFDRITAPKAADVLADQLRARIRSGEWPEGLALPTERDLSAQTSLSRTTVREALRMLEVDGLIEIRPGRGGGARVRRPGGDELTRQLELFIWGRNIGVDHLHDVRTALEALGAEGAARNRTKADLADLVAKTAAVEAAVRRPHALPRRQPRVAHGHRASQPQRVVDQLHGSAVAGDPRRNRKCRIRFRGIAAVHAQDPSRDPGCGGRRRCGRRAAEDDSARLGGARRGDGSMGRVE